MKFFIILLVLSSFVLLSNDKNHIFIELNSYSTQKEILKENLLKDIENKDDFSFFIKKVEKGLTDVTYYKYAYKYKEILVDKQTITISVKNNTPFLLTGYFFAPNTNIQEESYTSDEVLYEFKSNVDNFKSHNKVEKVFIIKNNEIYLSHKALIEYTDKTGYHLGTAYFDTQTGQKVQFYTHIYNALNRRIYTMSNKCLNTQENVDYLPGISLPEDIISSDSSANDAYTNTGISYWFYKNMFNRDSFDNNGITLSSSINLEFPYSNNPYYCHGENAAYIGDPYRQMLYGRGSSYYYNFAKGLDVTTHELTHAVTDYTSKLIYQNQQGALNEAISDIFAATAEAWTDSGGTANTNPSELIYNDDTWKIGEDIAINGNPIRYMNNPHLSNDHIEYTPDHYSEAYLGSQDNGGVHINANFINLAYYLLVVGGAHPRLEQDLQDVEGIGLEKAIKIIYEAQVGLFNEYTNFRFARALISQAAENLYGECSNESEQIHRAFDLVGVLGGRKSICIPLCEDIDCSHLANSHCIRTSKRAYCVCDQEFYEDNELCVPKATCKSNSCIQDNKTLCTVIDNEISCSCDLDENYEDQNGNCIPETKCEENSCTKENRTKCSIINHEIKCSCDDAYFNNVYNECILREMCLIDSCTESKKTKCSVLNNEIRCSCDDNYHLDEWDYCIQDKVYSCDRLSCENGICVIGDDYLARCNCNSGYFNSDDFTCTKINLCNNITCNNHGSCLVRNDKPLCSCNEGYHLSELNELECIEDEEEQPIKSTLCEDQNIQCSNHGECVVRNGDPLCLCDEGYLDVNLECIKEEKPDSSSCTYNSNENNSYLLFIIFGFLLFTLRKKLKKVNC